VNLTTGSSEILFIVECKPEFENGVRTRTGTGVEKDTDFGLKDTAEGREQPAMGVYFLGILLLESEEELNGWEIGFGTVKVEVGCEELLFRCDYYLRCEFEEMHCLLGMGLETFFI